MKKLASIVMLMAATIITTSAYAQSKSNPQKKINYVYCDVKFYQDENASPEVYVLIDYGQKNRDENNETMVMALVNDQNKSVIFNTKIDFFNYFSNLGWEYVQTFDTKIAFPDDVDRKAHFIFRKELKDGQGIGLYSDKGGVHVK